MSTKPELWAGAECSMVRVGDAWVDQLALTRHDARAGDLDRLAALGVRAVRFPVLWERVAPESLARAYWSWTDRGLWHLRELGIRPIVGLVHHGSGPRYASLPDQGFAPGLAAFARAVAERYPWVVDWTPVNEPATTARFSALYGYWYPHARSPEAFARALLAECVGTRMAMRAIRDVVPGARLVQTEDVGTTFATKAVGYQARFDNHRRFVSLDLLTGRIDARHPLRGYLVDVCGMRPEDLDDFVRDPSPPDLIGINYYATSDRMLDDRLRRYPPSAAGGNGRHSYADIEAVRVRGPGIVGHERVLRMVWRRYRLPLAITEVHLGCAPEEQVRWLVEAWRGAVRAGELGADVRAVTVWSVFGAFDWDSLLVLPRGHYEPGLFDVRRGIVRPTALASVARDLATCGDSEHPVLGSPGWWRRRSRLTYPEIGPVCEGPPVSAKVRPILVTGGNGVLASAIERIAAERALPAIVLARTQLDVADAGAVDEALRTFHPWAVVNAAGYVRVDDAEREIDRCWKDNAAAPATLADACARRGVRLVTFSSDLVFDGRKRAPYVERDGVSPLSVYGVTKAESERRVL